MGQHYMPTRYAEQVAWSATLVEVVGPAMADYGVPADKMAALVTADTTLHTCWTTISLPATRTRPALEAFRTALKAMRAAASDVVRSIRATRSVTPEMLTAAGLTIPKTTRTPPKRPTARPVVFIDSVTGREVVLRIQGEDARRARPEEAQGYYIYWAVADIAPTDPASWTWAGKHTKLTATVRLPDAVSTDAKVWFACNWVNSQGETGPGCEPVGTFLNQAGSPISAAPELKIAA